MTQVKANITNYKLDKNVLDKIQLNLHWWNVYTHKILNIILKPYTIKSLELNIYLTNNKVIKSINYKYRNKNNSTDVLSFPENQFSPDTFKTERIKHLLLGDIIISIDTLQQQALEYNHSIKREGAFLLTHGILHCLGYDHQNAHDEEIMNNLQKKILLELGIIK